MRCWHIIEFKAVPAGQKVKVARPVVPARAWTRLFNAKLDLVMVSLPTR